MIGVWQVLGALGLLVLLGLSRVVGWQFRNVPGGFLHLFPVNPLAVRFVMDREFKKNLVEELNELHRQLHAPTVHMNVFGQQILLTADLKLAEYVISHRDKYQALSSMRDAITARMGPSMFMSEGAKWQQKHKALQPLLNIRMLRHNVATVNEKAQELVRHLRAVVGNEKKELELLTELRILFVEVIGQVAFGTQFTDLICDYLRNQGLVQCELSEKEKRKKLLELAEAFFDALQYRLQTPKRFWGHGEVIRKEGVAVEAFSHCFKQVLAEYKAFHQRQSRDSEEDGPVNLLSLLTAQDESVWPQNEMLGECFSFFMAGHDTTSSTTAFTLGLLARNPAAQAKLREEARAILAEHNITKDEEVYFTFEDLSKMKYAHAVIKESMRMFPVAPGIPREAIVDDEFNGLRIPKGTMVSVNSTYIHRSPDFYDEPEKFIPERWLDPDRSPSKVQSPFAYLPFGTGARSCFGQRFAMLEMKAILGYIVNSFQLQPVPDKPLAEENIFGLVPRDRKLYLYLQLLPTQTSA